MQKRSWNIFALRCLFVWIFLSRLRALWRSKGLIACWFSLAVSIWSPYLERWELVSCVLAGVFVFVCLFDGMFASACLFVEVCVRAFFWGWWGLDCWDASFFFLMLLVLVNILIYQYVQSGTLDHQRIMWLFLSIDKFHNIINAPRKHGVTVHKC